MTQRKTPFDIFLTKDYTKATKEEQIAYLKKHEQKMTDFIKSQNAKVTSVQWDWDSVKVEEVKPNAGGFPTGDTYNVMLINGIFNDIKDSHFEITWQLSKNSYYSSERLLNQYYSKQENQKIKIISYFLMNAV